MSNVVLDVPDRSQSVLEFCLCCFVQKICHSLWYLCYNNYLHQNYRHRHHRELGLRWQKKKKKNSCRPKSIDQEPNLYRACADGTSHKFLAYPLNEIFVGTYDLISRLLCLFVTLKL